MRPSKNQDGLAGNLTGILTRSFRVFAKSFVLAQFGQRQPFISGATTAMEPPTRRRVLSGTMNASPHAEGIGAMTTISEVAPGDAPTIELAEGATQTVGRSRRE